MAHTAEAFDFEIDINGARVIVVQEPIGSGCLGDGEVDYQIESLKKNLDAVSKRMKAAIREQKRKPLFEDS